jgi:hypothetical protein
MQDANSRRWSTGALAVVIAALISTIGLSSVAQASPVRSSHLDSVKGHQLKAAVRQEILEAQRSGALKQPCRSASSGRRACDRIALAARSEDYSNSSDPNCPVWSFGSPYFGYGTIAESVGVFCVDEIDGQFIGGGTVSLNRGPLLANLVIWRHTGSDVKRGYTNVAGTSTGLSGCFYRHVTFEVSPILVRAVKLCGGSLFTHTPVGPGHGNYHGQLRVVAIDRPDFTPIPMLDVNSFAYCFYC